jgi:hypothetical protein
MDGIFNCPAIDQLDLKLKIRSSGHSDSRNGVPPENSVSLSKSEEANRDGAAPIDLVDGDQLADKLKELALGVKTELVEKVTVEPEWFLSL